ncbi:MAG: isoprenylcysteine carboxylmethyltransferase family protein [Nitrospiraceae bacterium]|nr:isoprenylcysteine carboxylmethyltransferase family protein [Nitrospiraceae bacterium]
MATLSGSRAFRLRGVIGVVLIAPVLLAILVSYPLIRPGSGWNLVMDIVGWGCYVTYVLFRIWAMLFLGGRKDSQLQTEGPYSITRNPLYVGSLFFALAVAFLFKSLLVAGMIVIIGIVYQRGVITAEEKVLEGFFGDAFREYCRRTPRFWPKLSLHHAPATVTVNLKDFKVEMRRQLMAAFLPIAAQAITYLRSQPGWPHWFMIP